MSDQNPLFIPGPTNMPDRLRHAMQVQTRDHRAPDFVDTLLPVLDGCKEVFGTKTGHVITFPASGTGGWEAAITNTLSPGDTVLVARYGMFSHRWIDMCQRHGLDVRIIECDWGAGAPADRFEEALRADSVHAIKAVLVTHNETATGVKSDIGEVRGAMDAADHPALLLVDCVSSLASMPFEMDAWGVDIAVSGSQKGFMLATGMAILAASPKALAAMDDATLPRTFFDFRDMMQSNATGGFPYTPPLQLIYGMRESLKMLAEEGLENVYARHHRLAEGVRRAVRGWGLQLVAQSPELYSDTVSAIYVPKGFNSNALTDHAFKAYGVSFGVGLGEMNGKAFRIGHLGSLTDVMVLSGLATIEMAMADLNYPIELGDGVSAAQEYFRTSRAATLKSAA
ncbi:L-aspartate--glyoxylate aminotransferase BhcA [Rhodophyticola porphyridii]|uniref:Aminotransferase class V-fold PLP-dependent enzyme n=1 Tax=Rhodophyticola porphyridii TaxID=1852017 RepID=A0A3L9Y2G7_9RHOB|nr:L-aspartate--glyoxylate aminotransferase BhcA [Rhodophyticola porphyridii]RMA43009.1 aminotransferase class V-fold PLP-dependent enzyme [Rhodophyticola porphyridii]